jgi:N utilization substance protein B
MDNKYVNDVVNGVLENLEAIDKTISKYLGNWDLDRLGKTDKAILRLGTYEILYYDTPKIVAINEAVELSKKYSDDKIVKLINAVLDKIRDEVEEVNE